MVWIKRNLFLAISGLAVVTLLVLGVVYLMGAISKNTTVEEDLQGIRAKLKSVRNMKPFPAESNIVAATKEVKRLEAAIGRAKTHFTEVPSQKVTGLDFKTSLDNAIYDMTQKAKAAKIKLPVEDGYAFTFAAQKRLLNLSPESFPLITEQLAEVQALCGVLFDSKVHSLIGLKRVPASKDDPPGGLDYMEKWQVKTNAATGAVIRPYEVSFTCFSADLGRVLDGLARSKHGFLVRAIGIDRFQGATTTSVRGGPRRPGMAQLPPRNLGPNRTVRRPVPPNRRGAPRPAPPQQGNVTIFDEERFLVVLWIGVIKPEGS